MSRYRRKGTNTSTNEHSSKSSLNDDKEQKEGSVTLYVGDLHEDVSESTLVELFNQIAPVESVRVCRDRRDRSRRNRSGRSLGYAYVNFHSPQDAERAMNQLNFTYIKGKQCRIMWCDRERDFKSDTKNNVFVKGLHPSIDNKTLYDVFSIFGRILSCKVARKKNGNSMGHGYVYFVDQESANRAVNEVSLFCFFCFVFFSLL